MVRRTSLVFASASNDEDHSLDTFYFQQRAERLENTTPISIEALNLALYETIMTLPSIKSATIKNLSADARSNKWEITFIQDIKAKYPPQEEIGFRVVGMHVHRPSSQTEEEEEFKSTRDWCMNIIVDTMQSSIEQCFFDGHTIKFDLMEHLIEKLNETEKVLRDSPKYRMYGSSLLIVYDAILNTKHLDVGMIDLPTYSPSETVEW